MAGKTVKAHPLLERAREGGNPVIDGSTVTFVWQGKSAPQLISDLHEWEENPQRLKPVASRVWSISFNLPQDAYLEYCFYDPHSGQHLPDPLNPNSCYNGVGGYNHFVYMPGTAPTPLTRVPPGGAAGRLSRHRVSADGLNVNGKRTIYFYHPPVVEPVPLLVVFDGIDYLRYGKITRIVDNLIEQQRIRPIALAMLQNGGRQGRMVEYACSETTLTFLLTTLLPEARTHLNLLDIHRYPGAYGVLGASMGGLMAVYSALRLPEIFGRAISQSGAFELGEMETVVMQLVRSIPVPDVRIWMDVGRLEGLLECNRKMHSLFLKQKYDTLYHEFSSAHNFTSWRNHLGDGLEALFV